MAEAPGGRVEKGEILLVIESEKAEAEVEASAGGWVRHLYAEVGQSTTCGALLAVLTETPDEPFDSAAFALHSSAAGTTSERVTSTPARAARQGGALHRGPGQGQARPRDRHSRARRLAEELGMSTISRPSTAAGPAAASPTTTCGAPLSQPARSPPLAR